MSDKTIEELGTCTWTSIPHQRRIFCKRWAKLSAPEPKNSPIPLPTTPPAPERPEPVGGFGLRKYLASEADAYMDALEAELAQLRAEIANATEFIQVVRETCFDDSEWGRYIDQWFPHSKFAPEEESK